MFKSRKLMVSLLATLFVLTFAIPAFAGDNVTVKVNGNLVSFPDQEPFIAESRTFVPLRFVSEALGGKVDWETNTRTATVDRAGVYVEMEIGSKTPVVNEITKTLDAPARLTNSRTMVPLRFVSEALGATVEWDADIRTVIITDTGAGSATVPEEPVSPVNNDGVNHIKPNPGGGMKDTATDNVTRVESWEDVYNGN